MSNFTEKLQQLMQVRQISSFRVLGLQAGISRRSLNTLRQGKAELLKYQDLHNLSGVLQISVPQLMQSFSSLPTANLTDTEPLKDLQAEFEQATIQQLEAWLLQWPTAAYAAQANPNLPARNLIPLMRPIEELLKKWGVVAIASVGEVVPYDLKIHQLMDAAEPVEVGDRVVVRYVGYCQREKLLYRARVTSTKTATA